MKEARESTFSRNLRALRTMKDITQQEAADAIGVTNVSLNSWERGRTYPRRKSIDDLIEVFGLTEDDLLSDQNGLYAKLHGLTDAPAGAVHVTPVPMRMVPVRVLGAAHAGDPDEPWEFDGEAMLYEDLARRHPRCFALGVNGTCMNRNFTDRDWIFVDPDIEPQDGSIGVVSIDGETVVRRIRRGNSSLMLIAETTEQGEWDDIVVQGEGADVRPLGTVFWWQSRKELA